MKHYVILFVEAEGPVDTWFTRHYVAEAEDKKDTPTFILPHEFPNYQTVKKLLGEDGFAEVMEFNPRGGKTHNAIGFTLEEMILGCVYQISAFFFDKAEGFLKLETYRRTDVFYGDLRVRGGS